MASTPPLPDPGATSPSASTSPAPKVPAFGRAPLAVAPTPRALVLINPRGAFASTTLRPLWFLGVIVISLFALLPPIAFLARVDVDAYSQRELKRSGRLEQMQPEQRETVVDAAAKVTKVALPVGAWLKRSLWMTFLTLACLAVARAAGKNEARMGPIAGAVAVAMAPLAFHDVITAATFLVKDPMSIEATNAVMSNPAAWFHLDAGHSVLGAVARGVDFFEIWSCALVGLGVTIATSWKSSLPYVVAFGGHALTVGIGAVSAMLS